MKRRILYCITAFLLIMCVLCAVACGDNSVDNNAQPAQTSEPERVTPTVQRQVDAAVALSAENVPDYTFTVATKDDTILESRDGDADKYLVADDGTNRKLVYLYEDISYDDTRNYRYFDVLMPTSQDKLAPETPVFVYLHGGGWVAGNRKEDELTLLPYLASTGLVVVTVEYALWFGFNQRKDAVKGVYKWENLGIDKILSAVIDNKTPVSVEDQQADITACLTYLRDTYLPSIGLNPASIGIGGYSAGAHLTSLYAYQQGDKSPIPLAYLMNLAGPVHMLNDTYMHWADLTTGRGATEEEIEAAQSLLVIVQPVLSDLAGALAGILGEETPIDASTEEGYQRALEGTRRVSPIEYVTSDSLPTIICYAKQHEDAFAFLENLVDDEYDDFIPLSVYYSIEAKLSAAGVVHSNTLFEELTHLTVGTNQQSCKWLAIRVAAYAQFYCGANAETGE